MKFFKQGFTRRAVCLAALMVATVGLALACVSCENGLGSNEKTGKYNLAEICSEIPDHVSSIYTANHDVRELLWSDPDNIKGEGSWNIQLSYKPFLVTGGEAPGLYYAVKACVNIDNSKMYKGRWWNKHGGTYVRLTGYYLNNFVATFMPTAKLADTEYPVEFPVNCEPTPKRLTTLQKLPVVIPVFLIKVYQKLSILTMKYNHFYQQYPLESLLLLDKVPYYRIVFL